MSKRYFLSGSALKLIAMLTMLIDHTALFIFSAYPWFVEPFLTLAGRGISLYYICRLIGRISFPIYCFLLVEGFIRTGNRQKYGVRLLIFALISELPWNFVHTGALLYSNQNVIFTLLFGYIALCAFEYFRTDVVKLVCALVLIFLCCAYGGADYGLKGLGLILVIYLLRSEPVVKAVVGGCMLGNAFATLAFIPISLYNEERGFMHGKVGKYIGYAFYPAHLLLLGVMRYFLFKV